MHLMVKLNRFGSVWDRNERVRQNDDKDQVEAILNDHIRTLKYLGDDGRIPTPFEEQLANLKNKTDGILSLTAFNSVIEREGTGKRDLNYLGWEVGTLDALSGTPLNQNTRARTSDFYVPGTYDKKIVANPGYKFIIYKFDAEGVFITRVQGTLVTSYEVEKGFKYKIVVGAVDNRVFTEAPLNAVYVEGEGEKREYIEPIDLKLGEYYHIDYPSTLIKVPEWNAMRFPVNAFQKYVYSGITNRGGTPAVAFISGGIVVDLVRLKTGENEFSVPAGIDQFGISVNDADLETVKLLALPDVDPAAISQALNQNQHIPSKLIFELPNPQSASFAFVRPSQFEKDNKYSGLTYSDGIVWRWMEDNKPAISATGYATVKASDSTLIAGDEINVIDWSASVTKTLTCLTAVENVADLNEKITIIEEDVVVNVMPNRVAPGDTPTYKQLIASAMIQSDNDASNAMARTIGYKLNPDATSITEAKQAFYDAMKQTALSIGMNNTERFGPAYDGLRTTPLDLCTLGIHIHNNVPEIADVWGLLEYQTAVTGSNPRTLIISSTTSPQGREIIPEFIGGKTGTSHFGAYLFMWEHKETKEVYATAILNTNIYNMERFINSRRIIDEVYSIEYNG